MSAIVSSRTSSIDQFFIPVTFLDIALVTQGLPVLLVPEIRAKRVRDDVIHHLRLFHYPLALANPAKRVSRPERPAGFRPP